MQHLSLATVLVGIALLVNPQRSAIAQPYNLSEFTGHAIGDTISLVSEGTAKSNILLFVNPINCFTCELSIENYAYLQAKHHLSVTMMIMGVQQSYADTVRSHNGWSFPVIADPMRLYEKFYSVKTPPFYYLTDGRGRIQAMDKIAGALTPVDSLEAILSRLDAAPSSEEVPGFSLIKRIHIHRADGAPLTMSPRRSICAFRTNGFAILDANFRTLTVVDSTGEVTDSYNLQQGEGRQIITPIDCTWLRQDTTVLISGISATEPGMSAMFSLNLKDRTIKNIPFDRHLLPQNSRIFRNKANPNTQTVFASLLPYMSNVRTPENEPTLITIDTSGKFLSQFGKPDSVLTLYGMTLVTDDCVAFDSLHIYECQSPTRTLNIYDTAMRLVRHLNINFGSPWFEFKRDFPKHPSMAYWVDVNSHISWTLGVFPSSGGNTITICYVNNEYPPGETDPKSSGVIRKYYVHRIDSDGNNLDDHDLLLPVNSRPFQIDGNIVVTQEYLGDHLDIVSYEAKKPAKSPSLSVRE